MNVISLVQLEKKKKKLHSQSDSQRRIGKKNVASSDFEDDRAVESRSSLVVIWDKLGQTYKAGAVCFNSL